MRNLKIKDADKMAGIIDCFNVYHYCFFTNNMDFQNYSATRICSIIQI